GGSPRERPAKSNPGDSMPAGKVRENEPFEFALRRFKRTCEKAGVLAETRKREYYEKPTQERKRQAAAAVKRQSRRAARDVTKRQRPYGSTAAEPSRLIARRSRFPRPPFIGTGHEKPCTRPAAPSRAVGFLRWHRFQRPSPLSPRRRHDPQATTYR